MRYKALLLALALTLSLSGCALTGPKTVATVTEPTIWEETPSITQWARKLPARSPAPGDFARKDR